MKLQEFPGKYLIPQIEYEILAASILKKDRSFINAYPETELTSEQVGILNELIQKRKSGEPIPYILGYKEFYGRNFFVNKNVLIPRPETENLVEKFLRFTKGKNLSVIDIGTGSGCIALTLKLEQPELEVFASDIDQQVLEVARENAACYKLDGKINFLESNLLEKLDSKVDVIVANLPYIPTKNWSKLPKEIKDFEPRVALDSGTAKDTLYKTLFAQAKTKLKKGGFILYEIDGDIFRKDLPTLVTEGY